MAELIIGDLADKAATLAERGHSRQCVRRRTARHFDRGSHCRVKPFGLFGVDQPHRPLGQTFGSDQRIVGASDDVDNGVADGDNVETGGGGHEKSCDVWKKLPRALGGGARQGKHNA